MDRHILRDRRWVLQALGASAAAVGCSILPADRLERRPRWFSPAAERPPVVFIHGAFGSRLRNRRTGGEIWPVGFTDLLVSAYDELAVPLDPETGDAMTDDIEAFDLFDDVGAVEFYGSLVQMLTTVGGYRRSEPGAAVDDEAPRLYALLWDWRRDIVAAARQLDELIEQIRAAYKSTDLKVDLVSHSSGGLVARYYLLHGAAPLPESGLPRPTFAGAAKVDRAVAIGVPELGMTRVAAALVEGEPVVLNRVSPEVLSTSASTCQLLPHGDNVWLLDASGEPIVADACDPDVWRELEMGVFDPHVRSRVRRRAGGGARGRARLNLLERGFERRLGRAQRFRTAIRAASIPGDVAYYTIGGDCRPTQARLLVETPDSSTAVRTWPRDVRARNQGLDYDRLMLEAGDGMVTRSSSSCSPGWPSDDRRPAAPADDWRWQRYVCSSHNKLVVNTDCQRALLRALVDDENAQRDPGAS
jgi:pimeloyl-ACP methyl ester carboxylesterase